MADNSPIHTLPDNYIEVNYLDLTKAGRLIWLNVLSFLLLLPFVVLVAWWSTVVDLIREPYSIGTVNAVVGWLGVILVFGVHEWLHGVGIRQAGHTPRYGWKTAGFGWIQIPYILFATADGAYFRRNEFLWIALLPVLVITPVGMGLMLIVPQEIMGYVAIAVVLNGGGAIGDLWMTWVTMRYPSSVLVQDEEDSIRIFAQML